MAEWERKVKRELLDNGFFFKRTCKGSHEMWSNGKISVVLPCSITRIMANVVLKEAKIDKRY